MDFKEVEKEVLRIWEEEKTYQNLKEKNKDGKKFYFLQGPPYTSGNIHIGHAWNGFLKDMVLRYKRMRGMNVFDRWGYDMHGLPTENKVQKALGLKSKEEIMSFGLQKFMEECLKFSTETASKMTEEFKNFGLWMDFDNAYLPIKPEFISNEWLVIKKAFEQGRLYKGKKSMTWDKVTETAHAKHELEYKTVTDSAIYVKFKSNEDYLIIWTTTPWTIPFNMGIMVNPDATYCKVKINESGEVWILAKDLVESVLKKADKTGNIIEEFPGKSLDGRKYEHFFNINFPESERTHTVILSKQFVTTNDGTGLVHCSPGCGMEDYEVGSKYKIPAFNTVDERGIFHMPGFENLVAKDDDKKFIELIEEKNALVAKEKYEHEYPHSWRSHEPVIFRTTDQWFMKTEDLRDQLIEQNKNVKWNPDSIKNTFESWISNLKDNAITRQRFWGCPVPIWEDEDGNVEVIGSLEELKEKAINDVPEDLHRPFIDEVKLRSKSGKEMKRIPDVLDVWIDSGTVSWNALNYPSQNNEAEVADFILEGADQARLWFTMLELCSTIVFNRGSYKSVYSHGMMLDFQGEKMSKSLGNVISPNEVIEKYSVDTLRYYICQTTAGKNLNFVWDELTLKQKNLMVLWNIHSFLLDLETQIGTESEIKGDEEHYILSRLNSTIKEVSEHYENYELDKIIGKVEDLFLELSRTYIQLTREKASGTEKERTLVYNTVKEVMQKTLLMFAPICPLITEKIYRNLFNTSPHLESFPEFDEARIDLKLEHDFSYLQNILQAGLAAREKAKISVRWPLKDAYVQGSAEVVGVTSGLKKLLQKQLNIKNIEGVKKLAGVKHTVKTNNSVLGKKHGSLFPKIAQEIMKLEDISLPYDLEVDGNKITIEEGDVSFEKTCPEGFTSSDFQGGTVYLSLERNKDLETEGFARELMRAVQDLRKKSGLKKQDLIKLHIRTTYTDVDLYSEHIKDKCGCSEVTISELDIDLPEKGEVEINNEKFVISFKQIE